MRESTVVIGANYGDEGKGLITDFEVRRHNAELVVRFNGGSQAGHTVQHENKRHVFGHVGSGTFAGASTFLGSEFIVNPFVLQKELSVLHKLGFSPSVKIHAKARVSTLYDMALNSVAELSRGEGRHGSCGLGINETVVRNMQFPLTASSTRGTSVEVLAAALANIRDVYVPQRLRELNVTEIPEPYKSIFESDPHLMASTMKYSLLGRVQVMPHPSTRTVFEGAQGLALDEYLGAFPYVTRSITGLPYAIVAAHDMGIDVLRPIYCTRAYLTRHGAGPLENEGVEFGAKVIDETNIPNEWQGSLRFAPLNLPMLADMIANDTMRAIYIAQATGVSLWPPTIALTCMDQLGPMVTIKDIGGLGLKTVRSEELPRLIETRLGYKVTHISRGPGAGDVEYSSKGV